MYPDTWQASGFVPRVWGFRGWTFYPHSPLLCPYMRMLLCAVQRSGTSPLAQPGFVALMLTVVNSSDKAKCWEQLLTDAFKGFAGEGLRIGFWDHAVLGFRGLVWGSGSSRV